MSSFLLAMIQMRVDGGDCGGNLRRAASHVQDAARRGVDVVLLPEAIDSGWTHPSGQAEARAIPEGESCQYLCRLAREHEVYLCAGLTERAEDCIYNAAVLIDPEGGVILHHRKLNELEIGHEFYAQGNRLRVVETPIGCFGVMICADAFARGQVISRALGLMGAQCILSPCAWAVPADHNNQITPYGDLWRENYGPVAKDFRLWIAGVSNVGEITAGPWRGRECIGCSMLVDPNGRPVVDGPYGENAETILYSKVDTVPRPARGDGWERIWAK